MGQDGVAARRRHGGGGLPRCAAPGPLTASAAPPRWSLRAMSSWLQMVVMLWAREEQSWGAFPGCAAASAPEPPAAPPPPAVDPWGAPWSARTIPAACSSSRLAAAASTVAAGSLGAMTGGLTGEDGGG